MQIHFPMFAEVKVLQQQTMLNINHMHTLVCGKFKWNYEQHSTAIILYRRIKGLPARMHL